jgi:WD40 repeat protein
MTKFVQEALVQYPTDQYPTTIQINNTLLAAATYNGNLHLNDKLTLKHRAVLPSNNIIKQIKLSDDSAWVCYNKQKAILWDIRTNKIDLEISSDYPLSCIDVKQNMLVLGSDLHGDDAFLCFYDIRVATQIMYRFDEMHSDDITQVHIHPNLTQVMISGSTDGLINLYDLSLLPEGQDECLVILFSYKVPSD